MMKAEGPAAEVLVLIGGGGHCLSCIDVIEAEGRFRIAGIIDRAPKVGQRISGHEVIGTDEDIAGLVERGYAFLLTLGQIKSPARRVGMFGVLASLGANMPVVISPSARVSLNASVGRGSIVMHQALVVAGAAVGENTILNSKSLVEHGARVGSHCHVSTAAVINGDCIIGDRTFVGSGAVVAEGVEVSPDCVIGAASIVRRSIREPGVYAGNPLRMIPGP